MPIVPCFDPSTGSSGGPQGGGGGGGMPPWELLSEINFKAQGSQSLSNGTTYTLTDTLGNSFSGTSQAVYVNQPDSSAGWDASRGYYTEIGAVTTNTVAKMGVEVKFKSGVSIGLYDDLRVTVTGLMNLPQNGHRQYWAIGNAFPVTPIAYGHETSAAAAAISQTRLNPTTAYLRFDAAGSQSAYYNAVSPQNPGTTLDMINGTQPCTMEYFQPRLCNRGLIKFIQPNISRTLFSWGGQASFTPTAVVESLVSPYSRPYPWHNKTSFWMNNTIYNGGVNGSGMFSQIHSVRFERRAVE
jgi:hypothetical protein